MNKKKAIELFRHAKTEVALRAFEELILQGIEDADIYCHYGILLENKGRCLEASEAYSKALKLNPALVPALANLGNQLKNSGHLTLAAEKLKKAAELEPKNSVILSNYANVLVNMGAHQEAYSIYQKALAMMSTNLTAYSNFLLSLNYTNTFSPQEIFDFHRSFSETQNEVAQAMAAWDHHKIRIAYISGDFKRHSVAYFIEGILHFHNRDQFEVFCYSDVIKPDTVTKKVQAMDLTFKNTSKMSCRKLKNLILADKIDILIDLAAHTGKRLKLFAMRSAPCQISYLGYGNTSGLKNMDYRIVDHLTDHANSLATEKLIRLQRPFIAFCPPENSPKLGEAPCIKNGFVTFGSFNNLPKITDEVIRLWTRILRLVPDSRIILKTKAFVDKNIQTTILGKFISRGIDQERVTLLCYQPTLEGHLTSYQKIDIALDSFPYNGTTTTCEALHMSVPLICLKGKTHISRVSASLLEHTGLSNLISGDKNEYVSKAVKLAKDFELINKLHQTIRPLMHQSLLCNSQQLTVELEKIYIQTTKRPVKTGLL